MSATGHLCSTARSAVGRRAWPIALGASALVASVWVALSAPGSGDYPTDAGPAMSALLHGNLHAFATSRPAMGELALFLRVPFAALAYLAGSPSELSIYRWGAVPCLAALALAAVWLAAVARARGTGAPGQVAIVALAIFNPLVRSALVYGHPEELLTTAFAVAAVACAAERRAMAAAVLVGLAMASKQWAVLALFGVLAMLDGERVRVCAVAVAVAAACSLPAVVLAPGSFVDNQLGLAAARYRSPAALTWLFLLVPAGVRHLPSGLVASGPRLGSEVAGLLHPLIIALGAVIALFMRRRGGARSPRDALLAAVALTFLLRCTLDPATMPYYHLPLLAALLAWDALGGGRLPLRGLAATAIAYLVFDRLTPAVIGPDTSSALYDAVTLGVAVLLVRALAAARGRGTPAPQAVGLRPPRPAL